MFPMNFRKFHCLIAQLSKNGRFILLNSCLLLKKIKVQSCDFVWKWHVCLMNVKRVIIRNSDDNKHLEVFVELHGIVSKLRKLIHLTDSFQLNLIKMSRKSSDVSFLRISEIRVTFLVNFGIQTLLLETFVRIYLRNN